MARILTFIVLALLAAGLHARELTIDLAAHGAVVLTVPDGWSDSVNRIRPDLPPTVTLTSTDASAFQVLITPIWPASAAIPKETAKSLRDSVRRAADQAQSQAIETQVTTVDFAGASSFGSYFSVTDRDPKPGEFKYMTQGMLALDDLRITFTILANRKREAITEMALHLVKTIRRKPAAALSSM